MSLVRLPLAGGEPVSLPNMCQQLRIDPLDPSSSDGIELQAYITAARQAIENWCRRAFVLQAWEWSEEHPHPLWHRIRCVHERGVALPYAPLLAVDLVQVTEFGQPPTPVMFRTYGRGDDSAPGRVYVLPCSFTGCGLLDVRWLAGYGGKLADLTVAAGVVTGYPFTQGYVGLPVTIGDAQTAIQSVDANGAATLGAPVPDGDEVTAYLGWPVPAPVLQAIKLLAADMYENRTATPPPGGSESADVDLPRAVRALLNPYRNLVS